MSSEDEDLPRLLSGRYRLESTLGRGGMGVVYRGTDLMMKRAIAVKLIRAVDGNELDDEIAGRFLREAKNTARLQHEHIIEVFDLGRSDEGMYFVMELLEGESLSARLRRAGGLSVGEAVHIGRQIAEALQVAHSAGVIHRDLKPANIMLLSRAGDDDFVKVLDFGVAKSTSNDGETQLTHTGMLVGTVDYMAPEQIMGKPVDGRTDIYALGIVLYKMLSGMAPFRDAGVPALIHAHMNTMPKPLIEVADGIPNELDRVVLRCLAKSPDRRYESMAEVARALTASIAPSDDGLVDLSSDESDAYGFEGELTAVAQNGVYTKKRPASEDLTINHQSSPRALLESVDEITDTGFDDATIKMDRSSQEIRKNAPRGVLEALRNAPSIAPRLPAPLPAAGRPATTPVAHPPPGSPAGPFQAGQPASLHPVSGGHRSIHPASGGVPTLAPPVPVDDVASKKHDVRVCAMCAAINAPHARVCSSCGTLLVQDARLVPRGHVASHTGPQMPMHQRPPAYGQPNPGAPMQYQPHLGQRGQPPPPPSMWERFLTWTGLRGRSS